MDPWSLKNKTEHVRSTEKIDQFNLLLSHMKSLNESSIQGILTCKNTTDHKNGTELTGVPKQNMEDIHLLY